MIPLMDVICRGNPIKLQPNKTRETEKGKMAVTTIADRNPRKNKLKDSTKNIAREKLVYNSENFAAV